MCRSIATLFKEIPAARFDGRSLPFAKGSFDVTVCCYVMHHLTPQHAKELLGEMIRVTRRSIVLLEDSLPQFDWFYDAQPLSPDQRRRDVPR